MIKLQITVVAIQVFSVVIYFKNSPRRRSNWQQSCDTPLDDAVKQFSPKPWREDFFSTPLDLRGYAHGIAGFWQRVHSAGLES
jgi:hypothetical protein